jgi:hypothetical protein
MLKKGDLLRSTQEYGDIYGIFVQIIKNDIILVIIPNYGTWTYPKDIWLKL